MINNSERFEDNYKWKALVALVIGTFMAPLDGSIVNITLPHISEAFGAGIATVEWVVMSYLLVISSLLLTWGRLGDMLGYKNVYIGGFVIFTIGSVLCALSPTIWALIGFRAVQALGAGMMMVIGPALVTSIFPPHERGKALGIIGSTVASALAFGPVIGGILVNYFGWRSIFLINLPIGILAICLAMKLLKPVGAAKKQVFDIPGALTIFLALMTFLLAASHGQQWGWTSPIIVGLLTASILFFIMFIYFELRVAQPMLDLSLFKIRLFTMANISALISFMSHFCVVFILPFFLYEVRLLDPAKTGMLMAASPLVTLVVAPMSGTLSDRIGSRSLSSLGLFIVSLALLLLSTVQADTPYLQIVFYLAILGLGSGLFQSPNSSAIMGSVPRQRLGIASGTLASMRNIGMVLGVALAGAIFTTRLQVYYSDLMTAETAGHIAETLAFTGAMHDVFLTGSILAVLGVLTSLVRGRGKQLADTVNRR